MTPVVEAKQAPRVLAGSLRPEKTGVYMGILNFLIVIPEILALLFFGWVMDHLLNNKVFWRSAQAACS